MAGTRQSYGRSPIAGNLLSHRGFRRQIPIDLLVASRPGAPSRIIRARSPEQRARFVRAAASDLDIAPELAERLLLLSESALSTTARAASTTAHPRAARLLAGRRAVPARVAGGSR